MNKNRNQGTGNGSRSNNKVFNLEFLQLNSLIFEGCNLFDDKLAGDFVWICVL